MKLNQLLESIDIRNDVQLENTDIKAISYHSQKTVHNSIFVCIKGYKVDGHKYLASAVQNGATVAVVEERQEDVAIPQILVENSRIALAQLGSAFYNHPSEKLKTIGITATNGKTTTSYMANAILENAGLKTGLVGTVSIKIDDTSIDSELTTPESLDLQKYLSQMVEKNVSHLTMEVSSAALEMNRVSTINYDIVALNNISREHVDTHGSFERYWEVKSSLIKEASEESFAILNLDSPYSASLVDQTRAKVISFGIENKDGYINCKNLDLSTGRAKFTVEIVKSFDSGEINYTPGEFDIELGVPGLHSVYNSMVAITIGLLCNVPVSTIQRTLKEFGGVPRRFEFVYEDEFKIVDDHFANPGNIDVTLGTLNHMEYENLHLVYAIRGQRGPVINRENAEAVVERASELNLKEIIATKSVSHASSKDEVTDDEVTAFVDVMKQANIKVEVYDELPDAVDQALSRAENNDLILLAGCQGMDYGAGIALEQIKKTNSNQKQRTV